MSSWRPPSPRLRRGRLASRGLQPAAFGNSPNASIHRKSSVFDQSLQQVIGNELPKKLFAKAAGGRDPLPTAQLPTITLRETRIGGQRDSVQTYFLFELVELLKWKVQKIDP